MASKIPYKVHISENNFYHIYSVLLKVLIMTMLEMMLTLFPKFRLR